MFNRSLSLVVVLSIITSISAPTAEACLHNFDLRFAPKNKFLAIQVESGGSKIGEIVNGFVGTRVKDATPLKIMVVDRAATVSARSLTKRETSVLSSLDKRIGEFKEMLNAGSRGGLTAKGGAFLYCGFGNRK